MPPEPPKKPLARFAAWVKSNKKTSLIIAIAILVVAGITTWAVVASQSGPEPKPEPVAKKEPKPEPKPVFYSPLTGVEVASEADTQKATTAIIIENTPDARPQSGLKNSGVVFEAITEGGITRFLVIYQQEKPGLIGPVRSLRTHYVDWLAPFNPSVAHVGGSRAALDEIRNGNYRDIDQFFNSGSYWRASDRYAPHNVYTSFERLDALNQAKGYTEVTFEGFARKNDAASEAPSATAINVTMSGPLYNSSYTYDAETNSYLRSQGGGAHEDREEGRISPKVVVIMQSPMVAVTEDGYRESIQTIGSGSAWVFQDGTVTEGRWEKSSRQDQVRFVNGAGEEIKLNRGQTWISSVPEGRGGVTWQ